MTNVTPRKRGLLLLWSVLGPGLLGALADNDAGGVISYAVTGARFGYGIFLPLTLCLVVITYTVQEMAMRLGVVSGKGYNQLVRERYGKFWMVYQVVSLLVENIITLITEFIGMSAGLMMIGIPMWAAVLIGLALVCSLALYRGYAKKERIAIIVGLFNVVFIVVAFLTKPDFSQIGTAFLTWNVPQGEGRNVFWYVIALVGNAIAPWMIFYQNGAYVEKGAQAKELRHGRMDTLLGCVCQVLIAAFIIVIGASLSGHGADIEQAGPIQIVQALDQQFGSAAALLFGLGLFNAGLLASMTVSLSSSWSVAQAFGWSKSLGESIRQAPKFYAIYFGSVLVAAGIVLIPGLPLNCLAVLAQVLGGILMTPILIFLTLLTSSKSVMGDYRNRGFQKVRAWVTVALLAMVSIATVIISLS